MIFYTTVRGQLWKPRPSSIYMYITTHASIDQSNINIVAILDNIIIIMHGIIYIYYSNYYMHPYCMTKKCGDG